MKDFLAKQIAKLLGIDGIVGMKLPTSITVGGVKIANIRTESIGGGIGIVGCEVCGIEVAFGYDD